MKNKIFMIIAILGLISCGNNSTSDKYSYENYKVTTNRDCSQISYSENKINRIDLPSVPKESTSPAQYGFKKIDTSFGSSPEIGILKDNKFISLYTDINSHLLMGKIFNISGEEVVKRFKIIEAEQKELINYKLVTDERFDYFLVFYLIKNGFTSKREFFVKKYDLSGNQLGQESKLNVDTESFLKVTYSFDQDGKNLILNWIDTVEIYERGPSKCMPFLPCSDNGDLQIHRFYIIKYVKFDENLNYCFNSIGLDKNFRAFTSYITKDREKIIFTDYKRIRVLNLKDNHIKDIVIDVKKSFSSINKFVEDNENYFFINRYGTLEDKNFITYKLNKNFSIIETKNQTYNTDAKTLSVEDLKNNTDRIEIFPGIFFDNNSNLFKFEYFSPNTNIETYNHYYDLNYNSLNQSIFKIDNKLLYVNGDNFTIL